jgi:hypothetical protein
MFDPDKLGEEADNMIAELNQQKPVEEQPAENGEAIAREPETTANSDTGVETQTTQPDISAQLNELKKQAETADQRWRVLQGMIDKKDEEITTLRTLLAQLSSQQAPPAEQKPTQITQADITEYGTDLIDMVGRKAAEVVRSQMNQLEAQIAEIRNGLSGVANTTVKSAQERFSDVLTSKVPDWEALNVDPAFLSWLAKPAPFSRETKLDLLRRASNELDANKAAEFFFAYKQETNPAAAPQADRPDAAKFVTPGKAKAPVTKPEGSDKRLWTRADIAKLYDDKMSGKISQTEFDKMEADLFKAQRENRIAA